MRVDRYLSPDGRRWLFRAVFQAGGKQQTSEGHESETAAVLAGVQKMNEIHIQRRAEKRERNAQDKKEGIHTWHCARLPRSNESKEISKLRRPNEMAQTDELVTTGLVLLGKITAGRDELRKKLYREFGEGHYFVIEVKSPGSRKILDFWQGIIISSDEGRFESVYVDREMLRTWQHRYWQNRHNRRMNREERFLHYLSFLWKERSKTKKTEGITPAIAALEPAKTQPKRPKLSKSEKKILTVRRNDNKKEGVSFFYQGLKARRKYKEMKDEWVDTKKKNNCEPPPDKTWEDLAETYLNSAKKRLQRHKEKVLQKAKAIKTGT